MRRAGCEKREDVANRTRGNAKVLARTSASPQRERGRCCELGRTGEVGKVVNEAHAAGGGDEALSLNVYLPLHPGSRQAGLEKVGLGSWVAANPRGMEEQAVPFPLQRGVEELGVKSSTTAVLGARSWYEEREK